MTLKNALWRLVAVVLAAGVITGLGTLVGLALPQYSISQKGREFHPGEISFDSGDQEPGSKTDVTFPVAGDFDVLCAIHPKMKLTVHVQ